MFWSELWWYISARRENPWILYVDIKSDVSAYSIMSLDFVAMPSVGLDGDPNASPGIFRLPTSNEKKITLGDDQWHRMGTHGNPSEVVNIRLKSISTRYIDRKVAVKARSSNQPLWAIQSAFVFNLRSSGRFWKAIPKEVSSHNLWKIISRI